MKAHSYQIVNKTVHVITIDRNYDRFEDGHCDKFEIPLENLPDLKFFTEQERLKLFTKYIEHDH